MIQCEYFYRELHNKTNFTLLRPPISEKKLFYNNDNNFFFYGIKTLKFLLFVNYKLFNHMLKFYVDISDTLWEMKAESENSEKEREKVGTFLVQPAISTKNNVNKNL